MFSEGPGIQKVWSWGELGCAGRGEETGEREVRQGRRGEARARKEIGKQRDGGTHRDPHRWVGWVVSEYPFM